MYLLQLSIIIPVAKGALPELMHIGVQLLQDDIAAAVLCLDLVFAEPSRITSVTAEDLEGRLMAFSAYSKALSDLAFIRNPVTSGALHRLLAFSPSESGGFLVRDDSLLCSHGYSNGAGACPEHGHDLEQCIRGTLKARLLERVRMENQALKESKWLTLCLQHALGGLCTKRADCLRSHPLHFDLSMYRSRVQVLGLQILVYQTLSGVEDPRKRRSEQR